MQKNKTKDQENGGAAEKLDNGHGLEQHRGGRSGQRVLGKPVIHALGYQDQESEKCRVMQQIEYDGPKASYLHRRTEEIIKRNGYQRAVEHQETDALGGQEAHDDKTDDL